MEERVPVRTYVFMLGWGAGLVWILANTTPEPTLGYAMIFGFLAVVWLAIWGVIFAVLSLFAGFGFLAKDAADRLRK